MTETDRKLETIQATLDLMIKKTQIALPKETRADRVRQIADEIHASKRKPI